MTLEQAIQAVRPPCETSRAAARQRFSDIAMPLGSLGLLQDAVAQLAAIRADLDAGPHFCPEVTEADCAAHGEFLANMSRLPADAWQHLLRVTDRCIGCGICEKVCPSGSIRVADGRAVHTPGRCQTCLACAHACPQKAIALTVPEKNPQARYRNEHVTLQEIMQANGAPRG